MENQEVNKPLFRSVMNHIIEHPDEWNQRMYHCGTTACFAGRTQIMAGKEPNEAEARLDAIKALNISQDLATYLFSIKRSLTELYDTVKGLLNDEIDRYGYDRDGYDRHGYDPYGYDRDGDDRDGYDRHGYDRDGYNRDGYDHDGYDLDGYDRNGYDWHGYDRNGYNRRGRDRDGNIQKFELL